jgi:hypothetical protein
LAGTTDRLTEAVSKGIRRNGQAVCGPGVVGIVGERHGTLLIPPLRVDMDAKRILMRNQPIEQLLVPMDDEIDLAKAALNIGIEAHKPGRVHDMARTLRQAITKVFD